MVWGWNIYYNWNLIFSDDICEPKITPRFSLNFYLMYCGIVILLTGGNIVSIRAKIRSFKMYSDYVPVYIYSLLSLIFPKTFKKLARA